MKKITIRAIFPIIFHKIKRIFIAPRFKRFGKSVLIAPLKVNGAKYIEIGDNVGIHYKVWLTVEKKDGFSPRLVIDDGTKIGNFSTVSCMNYVYIGKSVLIADKVFIADNAHSFEDISVPIMMQPSVHKNDVHIGDGTWIGTNVTIMSVRIGKNCVIGANSVVTRDIPDYCVAAGAPAKIIKKYNLKKKQWEKV